MNKAISSSLIKVLSSALALSSTFKECIVLRRNTKIDTTRQKKGCLDLIKDWSSPENVRDRKGNEKFCTRMWYLMVRSFMIVLIWFINVMSVVSFTMLPAIASAAIYWHFRDEWSRNYLDYFYIVTGIICQIVCVSYAFHIHNLHQLPYKETDEGQDVIKEIKIRKMKDVTIHRKIKCDTFEKLRLNVVLRKTVAIDMEEIEMHQFGAGNNRD
jgi:hypothetical protein